MLTRRVTIEAVILIYAGTMPAFSVWAQEAKAPSGLVVSMSYENGKVPAALLELFAKYSVRSTVPFDPGKSVESYVQDICGSANAVTIDLFTLALRNDGAVVRESGMIEPLAGSNELHLPQCLPDPEVVLYPRMALPDTTFFKYFKDDNAGEALFGSDILTQLSTTEVVGPNLAVPQFSDLGFDFGDAAKVQEYLDAEVQQLAAKTQYLDGAAFEAFVAANDLVEKGADPKVVSTAISESFAAIGQTDFAKQLSVAIPEALKKYAGLPSEKWATLPLMAPPVSDGNYTEQIVWLDPNPKTQSGKALLPGHIALVPSFKKQTVSIVLDAALFPPTISEPFEYVQESVTRLVRTFDAEVTPLETQTVEPVANSRCDGATYKTWQSPGFATEFRAAIARAKVLGEGVGVRNNEARIVVIDSGFLDAEDMGAFGADGILNEEGLLLKLQEAVEELGTQRNHGTAVAGVAIGGPGLRGATADLGLDISITPRRIYNTLQLESGQRVAQVDWPRMFVAIGSAGDVYNLSFATRNSVSIGEFKEHLGQFSPKLFVVAAGNNNMNDDIQGVDLNVSPLFPQVFANELLIPNLITVAAFDGKGRAWFSNYNSQFVSIAAPGCAVDSWVPDDERKRFVESRFAGTSFAAPIVSFVAAVVHSLMPADFQAPLFVRSRILASADLVPELDGVIDGRLLNPIKAVSIFEDVVELQDGTVFKGQLGAINATTLCDNPSISPSAVLLKFARLPSVRNGKDSVLYALNNRQLQRVECNHSAGKYVGLTTATGSIPVSVDEVKDIVMRIPHNVAY